MEPTGQYLASQLRSAHIHINVRCSPCHMQRHAMPCSTMVRARKGHEGPHIRADDLNVALDGGGPMWPFHDRAQLQPPSALASGWSTKCNLNTAGALPQQQPSEWPVKHVHRGGRRKAWIRQQFNMTSGLCSHCGDFVRSRDATVKKNHLLNPRKCRCGE